MTKRRYKVRFYLQQGNGRGRIVASYVNKEGEYKFLRSRLTQITYCSSTIQEALEAAFKYTGGSTENPISSMTVIDRLENKKFNVNLT